MDTTVMLRYLELNVLFPGLAASDWRNPRVILSFRDSSVVVMLAL